VQQGSKLQRDESIVHRSGVLAGVPCCKLKLNVVTAVERRGNDTPAHGFGYVLYEIGKPPVV
jgi:hypothetical protein